MAYNLESLVKIIEHILHPHHHHRWTLDPNKKPEIESLLNKARALKQLFRNSLPSTGNKIESLENRIRDATYEAEDILESHLVDQIRSVRDGDRFILSPPSLQKVIEELYSAEEEIKKMMDDKIADSSSTATASPRTDPNPKKILVGLSQDSLKLMERLTRPEAKLEIIPIEGMGGIGKTTLARHVYDQFATSHFDTRAWVTISQEYNVREILLDLLSCIIGKPTDETHKKETDKKEVGELGVDLSKSLFGRRYLIVLDDMWDIKAWDDIQRFFPDGNDGSRVLVTTRLLNVANYVGPSSLPHKMQLLNKDDSWNLLRGKVFAQETCPAELETIGKRISENCGGLPLAIHVIGGVLSQAARTQEYWMQIEKDVTSVIANSDEQFPKILSLSYNHLPNQLKPCFLYMGAFPEDYEIRSSKLIRLWVAEGFLEPISDKSLEEAAEMSLKALVDRNLIFVRRQKVSNGMVKSYGMHDLLRDLCIGKACQEKFFYVKTNVSNRQGDALSPRCVSVGGTYLMNDDEKGLMRLPRSLLTFGHLDFLIKPTFVLNMKLLRVLDFPRAAIDWLAGQLTQLVNLRFLATGIFASLPSSISALSNLQTIILKGEREGRTDITCEQVFDIPHLRHVVFKGFRPSFEPRAGKSFPLQENLRTLSSISVTSCFHRIIESTPNLKKLGIFVNVCEVGSGCYNMDLTCLCQLETLKVSCYSAGLSEYSVFSHLTLPSSLKKLTLYGCRIPIKYMNEIGTLPNLEVLKLRRSTLESSTWETTEGEFSKLQFLLLELMSNLVNWEADDTHFPRLERLVIRYCTELEELPSGIGEISTLEIIEVHGCSTSLEASARKIQEEQLELGNDGLKVLITQYISYSQIQDY